MTLIGRLLALPRDGPALLVAGFGLSGLSAVCGTVRLRLGPGQYPVWVPLAIDASIALAAGLVLVLFHPRFEAPDAEASGEFVRVKRSVWESIQDEVVAARTRERPIPADQSATEEPATPPPVVHPWDEGPPIFPQGPPTVPSISAPPPSPIPTLRPSPELMGPSRRVIERVAAAKNAARPLTPQELEEIEELGSILGFVPHPEARQGKPADERRTEVGATGSLSPSLPSPRTPTPAPTEPRPSPTGERPDIDELMAWLDSLESARGSNFAVPEPVKSREKKETGGSNG